MNNGIKKQIITINQSIKKAYATYHVGLKILLKREDEFLFLTNNIGKRFDFPGGRINDIEYDIPLIKIIEREVREELGEKVRYKLGKIAF